MTRYYSVEELSFLRSHIATPRRKLTALFNRRFGRCRSVASITTVMKYNKWRRKPRQPTPMRLNQCGYMVVMLPDGTWRLSKELAWEEVVGPIPPGYVLLPVYGDKLDHDPLNWIMVAASMAVRLNHRGFGDAPHELKPTILATARLRQAIEHTTGKRLHDSNRWRRLASMRSDGRHET